ncbi:hypothetical protein AB0P31_35390, partial [Streptomyces sp. NPDC088357]
VTGQTLQRLTGDTDWVSAVAFSPDGTRLATGSGGAVRIWDPVTGQTLQTLGDTGMVSAVAFSPGGTRLATGGGWAVRIWDPVTGEAATMMRTDSNVLSCAYSPDGHLIIAGTTAGLCAYTLQPYTR